MNSQMVVFAGDELGPSEGPIFVDSGIALERVDLARFSDFGAEADCFPIARLSGHRFPVASDLRPVEQRTISRRFDVAMTRR